MKHKANGENGVDDGDVTKTMEDSIRLYSPFIAWRSGRCLPKVDPSWKVSIEDEYTDHVGIKLQLKLQQQGGKKDDADDDW